IRRDPQAVQDAQHDRAVGRGQDPKAWTIAPNSSGFSDAPPTRAPSIPSADANSPTVDRDTLPPYRIRMSSARAPWIRSAVRIVLAAPLACAPVAGLPVPMAHTGSYATTTRSAVTPGTSMRSRAIWPRQTASGTPRDKSLADL